MKKIKQTTIDRVVGYLSPGAGLKRMAARSAMSALSGGGFIGAQGRRATKLWGPSGRSADADIVPALPSLRNRSRDAVRNQPIAEAAVGRTVTSVVGTGLRADPDIDMDFLELKDLDKVEEMESRIARDFDHYMCSTDPDAGRRMTGYDQQDVAFRATMESGDVLAARVMPDNQLGREIGTAWALIEGDRMCQPRSIPEGRDINGRRTVAGVEMDTYGAAIAYHILKQHPGNIELSLVQQWNRIDARSPNGELAVNHLYFVRRPEQTRGYPFLAPVMEKLKQLSDLSEAELFAAVISAMIALVHKSPGAQPIPGPPEDTTDTVTDPVLPDTEIKFEAGSTLDLDLDHEVTAETLGRPNSNFDPFFLAIVREIGAALELPAELLLIHFTSSYSASRAALEVAWQMFMRKRSWLINRWCNPVYDAWLVEQVARGAYDMPGFFENPLVRRAWSGAEWTGDAKISVDPLRENKADEIDEDHGWASGQQIARRKNGAHWRRVHKQRVREHKLRADDKLEAEVLGKGAGQESTDRPAGDDDDERNNE